MLSKAAISQIRLLHQKKHRDEQGLFIVEGVKSCMETLLSNYEMVECFVTERWDGNFGCKDFIFKVISEKEMERISVMTTAPEILCIVKKQTFFSTDFDVEKPLLVLDALKDPGNLGAIIRTADWFGLSQLLCSEDCVEFTNPKVIQATMGSFTRVKVVYANLNDYLKTQNQRRVCGLYRNGEPIQKQYFNHNDIIIIGSESHGISEVLVPLIHKKIEIPMFYHESAAPESLNAAMAAGIWMYAFRNSSIQIGSGFKKN